MRNAGVRSKDKVMRKAYMLQVRKVVISELTNNPRQTYAKTIKMLSCIVALNLSLIRFVD